MRIRPILNFSHIFFENGLQFQKLCLPLQPQTRKIGSLDEWLSQRSAKPCTAVRIRQEPQSRNSNEERMVTHCLLFFCISLKNSSLRNQVLVNCLLKQSVLYQHFTKIVVKI